MGRAYIEVAALCFSGIENFEEFPSQNKFSPNMFNQTEENKKTTLMMHLANIAKNVATTGEEEGG